MAIEYSDYENNSRNKKIEVYEAGGFIPSPIIDKGEVVNYVLVANNIENVAENLPNEMEISLVMDMEVTSIYGRTVIQKFMLRLQRENAFFNAGNNKNIFWNYCFESDPELG